MRDIFHLKQVFFSFFTSWFTQFDVLVLYEPWGGINNKRSILHQVSGWYNTPTMTKNFMYKIKEAVAVYSPSSSLPQGVLVLFPWLTQHWRKHFVNIKPLFFFPSDKRWLMDLIRHSVFASPSPFKSKWQSAAFLLPPRIGVASGQSAVKDIKRGRCGRGGEWRWWMHNGREVLNCLPRHHTRNIMAFVHKVEIYILTVMRLQIHCEPPA